MIHLNECFPKKILSLFPIRTQNVNNLKVKKCFWKFCTDQFKKLSILPMTNNSIYSMQ